MPVADINHYFVRANDLEATKNFYVDVLGFQVMPRPTFPFPGYWLGVEGKIQVHMGPHGIDNAELYYLGTPPNAATELVYTSRGGFAHWRMRASSSSVPLRFTRMPRSKSASAAPLTTAAR